MGQDTYTEKEAAEEIVGQMNTDQIADIIQKGTARHWLEGIASMEYDWEQVSARNVVDEIEALILHPNE